MYRSLFPRDLFSEMDRLQREMQQAVDLTPSIRGFGRGGFPAMNVGGTEQAVQIYAFAPGLDPRSLEIDLDRGVLTIAGQRTSGVDEGRNNADGKQATAHQRAFCGRVPPRPLLAGGCGSGSHRCDLP